MVSSEGRDIWVSVIIKVESREVAVPEVINE